METKAGRDCSSEVSREELYDLVWTTPISHLAEKFHVSGSYMARVCGALNVPRPPVGHWQKKAVGKDKPRPELSPALPGDQLTWTKDKPLSNPVRRDFSVEKKRTNTRRLVISGRHPLLRGVESHFRKSRKIGKGEFLRPYKLLLPDIVTSEVCLNQALDLANDLYNALEKKGHRVLIAASDQKMQRSHVEEQEIPGKDRRYGRRSFGAIWSPYRPTITYIGSVSIGLALTEMTERVTLRYMNGEYIREDSKSVKLANSRQLAHSWTTEQDLPSGRFRLVAYSPHQGVEWDSSWQETTKRTLGSMMPEIVRKLVGEEGELQALIDAADEAVAQRQREWEEDQERYSREEDQRCVAQALVDSQTQLAGTMEKWAAAMSAERFFAEAEARLQGMEGDRRERLQERLSLARSMLGTLDPLDFLEKWIAPRERYTTKYPTE